MLATWNAPGADEPMWRYLDNAGTLILMFFILLLLGVGHAGESWGLGSLHHRHRNRLWAEEVSQQEKVSKQDDDAFPKVPTYHRPY